MVLVWGGVLQDLADEEWVAGYPLHWLSVSFTVLFGFGSAFAFAFLLL